MKTLRDQFDYSLHHVTIVPPIRHQPYGLDLEFTTELRFAA